MKEDLTKSTEASGRRRHMSEEVLYVLEGEGPPWDSDIRAVDGDSRVERVLEEEPKRFT